ncbi:MAG: hypothetical protein GWO07_08250 [Candidatus Dadabacteria bacterium]|nr:hypothetical protein [Candidatus Dadabacteria bacterium]NIS08736.1 hypothetical protein [Candidatus Dadabacteria bacterium]NIV42620.1 hypothetical protein [Candidatus Dadabacteria bacterium]NIX15422.1 hypothetical protein [Candidatus Dadabacteria bacterium]NIY22085.1 hypothetical protein [Candidatus Dadabacteria bacterium]
MKKLILITFTIILTCSFNLSYGRSEDASSSFEEFVSNPSVYDKKEIIVEGIINKLKFTTAEGKQYTFFKIEDKSENILHVYYQGEHLNVKKGSVVTVVGEFLKKKRYSFYSFKNVVKAKDVIIET